MSADAINSRYAIASERLFRFDYISTTEIKPPPSCAVPQTAALLGSVRISPRIFHRDFLGNVVLWFAHAHKPFVEPADDVLQSFDPVPGLA